MIEDEHRLLAAVLHAMLHLVHEIRDRGVAPDFELLGAMIYYIDTFPERYHHPKESEYLFPLVCARHPAAAPLIRRLDQEHALGAERVRTLQQTLARYSNGGPSEFRPFLAAVEAYADLERRHMASEENDLMPLARQHLTPADWQEVDAIFAGHADPLLGTAVGSTHDELFRRILKLAVPPGNGDVVPPDFGD
jgi:hemerythrin-like domain-containing protein